ncbi:hypothetical protein BDZ89DRAFT_1098268 [Hymenopellis radicata]|nr:hypothetical protein BDZ89DRAFT_1098268 [Hymenopellis radicata]
MMAWTERTTVVFERALGLNELQFYHRGHVLGGATDSVQAIAFEIADKRHHVSEEMICNAWIAIKHKFPLLGAYIEVLGPLDEDIHFVVDTDLLKTCSPGEVMSLPVSSEAEADTFIDKIINGTRLLHDRRLVRLFILKRLDRDNIYHLLLHGAHCMTDGISHHATMRALLDILSSPSSSPTYSVQDRLALSLPTDNLFPIRRASLARQRWHKAIGHVIHEMRLKTTIGGQALPGTFTTFMNEKPAHSCNIVTSYTESQSIAIVKSCRKHGFTFGNAFPIIAQLAMARIICRHYAQGLISDDEWEFRKREPMWAAGPLNIRPYLDQQWYKDGGIDNVLLAIGFFFYKIPFMPLKLNEDKSVPDVGSLLSMKRFVYRCQLMKKQANGHLHHPLFLELVAARFPGLIQDVKNLGQKMQTPFMREDDVALQLPDMGKNGPVIAMGGSSFGRVDDILPRNYPSSATVSTPTIRLLSSAAHLRCRPGEVYLGAASVGNIMYMNVFWDSNVVKEDIVKEWLAEVKAAHYSILATTSKK